GRRARCARRCAPRKAAAAGFLAGLAALALGQPLGAQGDQVAQRLSSIVGVAAGEYAKGVDEHGRLISADEHTEAAGFLRDARDVAARLSGDRAAAARAVLDTLIVAADADRPPTE